jgi:hypothetical protein
MFSLAFVIDGEPQITVAFDPYLNKLIPPQKTQVHIVTKKTDCIKKEIIWRTRCNNWFTRKNQKT